MTNYFQDFDLSGDTVDIIHIDNLVFLKNLDRDFFTCKSVCSHFNFSKGAFTKVSAKFVMSHGSCAICGYDYFSHTLTFMHGPRNSPDGILAVMTAQRHNRWRVPVTLLVVA